MKKELGFTLLEIIVALFIVAIGIAAISKATGSTISTAQRVENRLMANWISSNQLTELRLSRIWPSANETDREVDYAGRTWHVKQKISTTPDTDILRVDIQIFADSEFSNLAGSMFGYLVRHATP